MYRNVDKKVDELFIKAFLDNRLLDEEDNILTCDQEGSVGCFEILRADVMVTDKVTICLLLVCNPYTTQRTFYGI